ncbi:MAG TPA: ATP-binding protein, partial [Burkholderiales bacterium]|nr:ATP-binding protein [Burkholderiales bacterium]
GPPPRFRGRDFARFARGSDDVRAGSGLGLSICETAMRRMGGTFRLDRSGDGCRFVMTFRNATPDRDAS